MRRAGSIGKHKSRRTVSSGSRAMREAADRTAQQASSGSMEARRTADEAELCAFLKRAAASRLSRDDVVMVCIGTDRSTGDAFGPLLGDRLRASGWPHVFGTLRSPCDADRLPDVLAALPAGKTVIAFDACLGLEQSVGRFRICEGPLRPAEAVGRPLPAVGDYSVAAVVAPRTVKPYHALQTASLALVMDMAEAAARAVDEAWGVTRQPECRDHIVPTIRERLD